MRFFILFFAVVCSSVSASAENGVIVSYDAIVLGKPTPVAIFTESETIPCPEKLLVLEPGCRIVRHTSDTDSPRQADACMSLMERCVGYYVLAKTDRGSDLVFQITFDDGGNPFGINPKHSREAILSWGPVIRPTSTNRYRQAEMLYEMQLSRAGLY